MKNQKRFKKMLNRTVASILVFVVMLTNFSYAIESDITKDEATKLFEEVLTDVLNNYKGVGEINERILFDAAMKGMFGALDEYSEYYTKEEYKEYIKAQDGYFYGIGATISLKNNRMEIIDTYKDSPAAKAGIMSGDVILEVDEKSVEGMTTTEVSNIVRGKENTTVKLKINRAGNIMMFEILRGKINEIMVTASSLDELIEGEDSSILYISLDSFSKDVSNDLIDLLNEYLEKGIDKVIIDLRDNTGGYFTEALKICGIFLDNGDIITTMIDKQGNEATYKSVSDTIFDKVVVLVNNNSASASELVTAAMQENDKCVVIGENTYGKSVAQNIIEKDDVNYKLTMNEYLTPLRNSIKGVGVTPDIIIDIPDYIYDIRNKYYSGDSATDVLTVKRILKYLGYEIGNEDEVYDNKTFEAVKKFQADVGVGSYGGIDYTTQRELNTALYNKNLERDIVLEKGIEVIKNYDMYIK